MGATQTAQTQGPAPVLGPPTAEQAVAQTGGRGNEARQRSVREQLAEVEREPGQIVEVAVDEDRVQSAADNVYAILADRVDHDGDALHIGALPEQPPPMLAELLRSAIAPDALARHAGRMSPAAPMDLGGGLTLGWRVQVYARSPVERGRRDEYVTTSRVGTEAGTESGSRTDTGELTSTVTAGGAAGEAAAGGALDGRVTHQLRASRSDTAASSRALTEVGTVESSGSRSLLDYEATLLMRLTLEAVLPDCSFEFESTTFDAGSEGGRSLVGKTARSGL